jgi:hypothetical protein
MPGRTWNRLREATIDDLKTSLSASLTRRPHTLALVSCSFSRIVVRLSSLGVPSSSLCNLTSHLFHQLDRRRAMIPSNSPTSFDSFKQVHGAFQSTIWQII